MTPEERAEKILYGLPLGLTKDEKLAAVTALIHEAVEDIEADRDRWADSAVRCEKAMNKAAAAAFDEAAKLMGECCEDLGCCDICYHAQAIRAHAAEVKK